MLGRSNLTNKGDMENLKKEIEKLKNENKKLKSRVEMLEEEMSIIKEDLYIDMEVELGDEEGNGCTGNCDSCKNKE